MISQSSFNFLITLFLFVFLTLGVLHIWKKVWLMKIPYKFQDQNGFMFQSQKYTEIYSKIIEITKGKNTEFLIKKIGFEGFAYLLFQKYMLINFSIMLIFSFFSGFAYSFLYPDSEWFNTYTLIRFDFHGGFQVISVVFTSFTFLLTCYFFKQKLKEGFFLKIHQAKTNETLQKMKLLTLCVIVQFEQELSESEAIYKFNNIFGKDYAAIKPIINSRKDLDILIKIENKKIDLLANETYFDHKIFCWNWRMVKKIESQKQEIKKLQQNMIDIISDDCFYSKNIKYFVCFRNLKLLKQFKNDYQQKKRVSITKNIRSSLKRMSHAYNPRVERIKEKKYEMTRISSEVDIFWKNFFNSKKKILIRTIAINVAIFLIFIFFTTPASFFSLINQIEVFQFITKQQNEQSSESKFMLSKYIQSLIIILINQLLLVLIDESSYLEKNKRIYYLQKTIYNKAAFYLFFNMIIVPTLIQTSDSIYKILKEKPDQIYKFIYYIYFNDLGTFFFSLIIQNGFFSFLFYLLRIRELFFNYFNVHIAEMKVKKKRQLYYLKSEVDYFQYGYFYALIATVVCISLIFSTTIPIIHIAFIFFIVLRFMCDSVALIFTYKHDCDSMTAFPVKVLRFCFFGLFMFHIFMTSSFYFKQKFLYGTIILILLLICLPIYWYLGYHYIYEYVDSNDRGDFRLEDVKQWEKYYSHPFEDFLTKLDDFNQGHEIQVENEDLDQESNTLKPEELEFKNQIRQKLLNKY